MRQREGIEPRHGYETVDADVVMFTEGHIKGAQPAMAPASPPGSKTVARHHGSVGNSGDPLGSSRDGSRVAQPAHREETRHPRGSRMPPYERRGGVTPTEPREAQKGARSRATPATRRGGPTATTGIERIATRARQAPQTRYTALMHYFTVDNLRACFEALDGSKAPGVDGVTKAMYGQHLEANLQGLPDKLHRMSYRPQPVRRVEIPKEDGSMRPLGISCTEDKIVQELTRRILEAIYEPTFIETSYGFRPGRSCHDALRQLNQELMTQPVQWVAALDLARFFDTMPHTQILAILAERSADRTFLPLTELPSHFGQATPYTPLVSLLREDSKSRGVSASMVCTLLAGGQGVPNASSMAL